jgi:hypothetical protein
MRRFGWERNLLENGEASGTYPSEMNSARQRLLRSAVPNPGKATMRMMTEPIESAPWKADQMNVVKLCHDYLVLHVNQQIGLRLDRAQRRALISLSRLFEGDPARRRRGHRRLPLILPVTVTVPGKEIAGTALNVSGGGLFVSVPQPVPVGSLVSVTIDGEDISYEFNGVVRWVRPRGSEVGLGLQFSAVPLARPLSASYAQPLAATY